MTAITTSYNTNPDIPNFDDVYLKGLLWTGARWGTGTGVTVTYSSPQSGSYYEDQTAETGAFIPVNTDTQRVISEQIISQFSSVANITFTLMTETPTDHADIRIAFSYAKAVTEPTVSGWAGSPGARIGGDVWLAKSVINGPYEPGAAPFQNVIHELGHAMDLKHTQESPAMPLEQESHSYSVMSYTEYRNVYMIGRGNHDDDYRAETLMLEDIRALQYIYGPNFNSKSGDTTYKWSESTGAMTTTDTALNGTQTTSTMTPYVNKIMMTVWDGGGTDTYDFSDYSTGVNVNLQPGEWTTTAANQLPSYDVDFGPAAAPPGNIANAYLYLNPNTGVADLRSLIENAKGGSGDDVITGNQAANNLKGENGNDKLYGLEGADTLEGGLGDDYLSGDAGDDSLLGGDGKDSLYGGDGADVLEGGAGDDLLRGGAGDDTYQFGFGSGKDTIIQGDGGTDKLVFGAGVKADSITWTRSGFDLVATLTGGNDQVTLKNWYWGAAHQLKVYLGTTELTQLGSAATLTDTSVDTLITPSGGGTVTAGTLRTLLTGSANSDTLNGGGADDTLVGGAGSDALNGGGGDDLYLFNRGDGADTISDSAGSDTLSFGYGVSVSDITIAMSGSNIIVGVRNPASPTTTFANLTDKITIQNWMTATQRIETFQFADGTSLDLSGIVSRLGTDGADTINLSSLTVAFQLDSGSGNDSVTGGSNNDTIEGGAGNDTIIGGNGDDLITGGVGDDNLTGGLGNDTLMGGGGNDTYIFNRGDGKDWIYDYYYTSVDVDSGNNTLSFGTGITINDLLIILSDKNLVIGLKNANSPNAPINELSDTITIFDWLTKNHRVETFKFDNRSSYSAAQLFAYMGTEGNDTLTWTESAVTLNGGGGDDRLTGGAYVNALFGGDGDDTLDGGGGGSGVDTLRGGAGDDLYLFGKGYGKVLIIQGDGGADRLQFLSGVSAATAKVTKTGADLIITWTDNSDQVTIQNYYLNETDHLNYFFTVTTRNLASIFEGSRYNDSIIGSQLDDTMTGGEGNDTFDGGFGKDTMSGGKGDDTYYVGYRIVYQDKEANAIIDVVIENAGEGIDTVYSYFTDYTLTDNVENLVLIDYYPLGGSPRAKGAGNELANTITGNSSSNVLNGMGGNDTLIGGNGNDTLDGGTGDDTAIFSGTISQYSLYRQNDGSIKVTDNQSGRDGTDTVTNIEHLRFSDGEILVSAAGIAPSIVVSGSTQISCTQSNTVKPFTGVTISNYVSGTLETLTIKLTGGGSLSGAGLLNPTTGVYTIAGTPANVTERLRDVSYTPPAGALAPGAETTFELSNTSSAYATAVTNSAIKVVIDNNATTLTITSGQSPSVAENVSSQTAVYTVQAANPTANAPLTYSITGGADASDFNIDRNTGVVTFRYVPNFEAPVDANADNKYEIVVTASDGIYTASKSINIDVTNVNEAPSITSLATAFMNENTVTTGYTALATDPDANTTFTYSILDQDDGRLFRINPRDGTVTFIEAPNYERPQDSNSDNIYQIVVQVSDGALTATKAVSITVRNVNEPPSITSGDTAEVTENTRTPVYTVSATDPDVGQTLTYSLSGADYDDFNINSSTGEVTFKSGPDFERKTDANTDNTYEIVVTASDRTNSVNKNVSIKVLNVEEAPVFTSKTTGFTNENRGLGVYTAGAFDPEGGAVTYSITGGVDARFLQITNLRDGVVTFKTPPDYETPKDDNGDNVYQFTVTASDGRNTSSIDVAISVYDLVEALPGAAYSWVGASGHIYGLYKTAKTWAAAKSFAETLGGYLAKVDTDAENTEIFSKVLANFSTADFNNSRAAYNAGGAAYVWLGATDATVEGTWRWVKDNSVITYAKWGSGELGSEPDNFSNQDYLALGLQNWPAGSGSGLGFGTAGQWNDIDGVSNSLFFVVEKDPVANDFDGDGKSDIFLQNVKDGQGYIWQMKGLTLKQGGASEVGWKPGADWVAKATGDFNGDGKSDVFLQNVRDGQGYVWGMNGLTMKQGGVGEVGWKPGKDWVARATGDFDGDGKSDVLLQNVNTGGCYIWEMDSLNLKTGGYGVSFGEVGTSKGANWQVKATGDFDGDGKSDILFQNIDNGTCHIWLMDGLNLKQNGSGDIAWTPGKEWVAKGTGDYDGDGKSDVLLQNINDGTCYIWEMNSLNLKVGGSGEIGWKPGADWHAVA